MATTTALPTRFHRVRPRQTQTPVGPAPTDAAVPAQASSPTSVFAMEKRARGVITDSVPVPSGTEVPNVLVVELSTAITIQHFREYYGVSPADYTQPHYHRLGDGSLIADPLVRDMQAQHVALFIIGMAFLFFLWTSLVSLRIVVFSKFKNKVIQYMLALSQVLGAMSYSLLFVGHLNDRVQCTPIIIASNGAVALANFLLTAILGVKAYRCLNNSRIVLTVLVLCGGAFVGISTFNMTRLRGIRRLAGSCIVKPGVPTLTPYLYIVQFVATVFVCNCFIFAIWKSSRLPASRGRISINLSSHSPRVSAAVEDQGDAIAQDNVLDTRRRGWWDYEAPTPPPKDDRTALGPTDNATEKLSIRSSFPLNAPRKSSLRGDQPIPQPPRPSTLRVSTATELASRPAGGRQRARAASPAPSAVSRFTKLIPRVSVFREAMQDELKYTALIAAISCLSAVLASAGVMAREFLPSTGWTALNWAVVSCLIIHSFSRVVRRHEDEDLIRRVTAWDPTWRTRPASTYSYGRARNPSRPWTPASGASQRRGRRGNVSPPDEGTPDDPFAEHDLASVSHYTPSEFDHISLRSGASRVRLIDSKHSNAPSEQPRPPEEQSANPWLGAASAATGTPTLTPTSTAFAEDAWKKPTSPWLFEGGPSPSVPCFSQSDGISRQASWISLSRQGSRDDTEMRHPLDARERFGQAERDSGSSMT